MSAEKIRFARAMIDASTLLSRVLNNNRDLYKAYFIKGYDSGGADPIIDADLNPSGSELFVSAADVANGITLAENLVKFLTNSAEASFADYAATLAKLRGDL